MKIFNDKAAWWATYVFTVQLLQFDLDTEQVLIIQLHDIFNLTGGSYYAI